MIQLCVLRVGWQVYLKPISRLPRRACATARSPGMRSRATCSPACSRNCSSSPRSAGCTATSSSSRRARSSCMARRARSGSRPSRTTIFACAQTNVRRRDQPHRRRRARARRHAGAHPHQNANRRRPRAQALPRAEHPLLNVLAMPLQLHGSCETRRAAGAARVCACSCARALVACDRCSASLRGGLIHAHDRYDDRRDRERYDDRHRDRYSRRRSQSRSRSRSCSRPHCAYLPASAFEAAAHWLRFLPSGRPGGGRATRGVKTSASAASL